MRAMILADRNESLLLAAGGEVSRLGHGLLNIHWSREAFLRADIGTYTRKGSESTARHIQILSFLVD